MLNIKPSSLISFTALKYILISLGTFLTIGIYNITQKIWMPGQMILKEKRENEWGKGVTELFSRQDAVLAGLGYSPYLTISVVNLQSPNMMRIYRHPTDPASITINVIGAYNSGDVQGQGAVYAEISTRYLDGTSFTTLNANTSSVFISPPHITRQRLPGVTDVVKLKAMHDKKTSGISGMTNKPFREDGQEKLKEDIQKYHSDFCALNESKGLLRFDKKASVYRATVLTALWGIANFMNPLADNFTWPRFIAGLMLGFFMPFTGSIFCFDVSKFLATFTGLPMFMILYVFLFLVFGLAGCVIGFLFTGKSFIWGFLLGYIPCRVVASVYGGWFYLDLFMAICAYQVSRWVGRRQTLL